MDAKRVYRDQIVRAVLGTSTAQLPPSADAEMLECLCLRLAELEEAKVLLRQKGYGEFGQSIVHVARMLPEAILSRFRAKRNQA